jgi:hypothetical protein
MLQTRKEIWEGLKEAGYEILNAKPVLVSFRLAGKTEVIRLIGEEGTGPGQLAKPYGDAHQRVLLATTDEDVKRV